ncbi:MAG: hypothetical protein ACTHMU_15895 [Thermomicrobiales bacterium]
MSTQLEAAIDAATSDPHVRTAMRLGALLEGGSYDGPWDVGDQGSSFGPFQIHLPAHPGVTRAQAEDPTQAVLFMLGEYQAAALRVPASAWAQDPATAAAQVVYYAERPAAMYPASRIRQAWAVLSGGAPSPDPAGGAPGPAPSGSVSGGAQPTSGGGLLDLFGPLLDRLGARDTYIRLALVMVGGALVIAGVFLVIKQPATAVIQAAT